LQNALSWSKKYLDQSHLYQHHKDLNDYLVYQGNQQKQSQKMGSVFEFNGASYVLVIPKLLAPLMLRIRGEFLMLSHSI
jgi:hypothetical protein